LKPVSGFLLRHWCGTKIIIRFWLTTDRLQTVVILINIVLLSLCHINVLTGNHWQASNCGDINQKRIIILRHWCGTKIIIRFWLISPHFEACQWFPVKTLMWHKDNNTLLINFIIVWSLSVVSCQKINQKRIIMFVPHQCLDRKPLTGFKLWWNQSKAYYYLCATSMSWQETTDRLQTRHWCGTKIIIRFWLISS
jgi:hypothetical protein